MSALLRIDFKHDLWPKTWLTAMTVGMGVLTCWVVSLLVFGFSLPLFILAMMGVGLAVLVQPTAGLPIIILGTMWFERWFTLQSIVLGDQTYKIYPLDIVFFVTVAGFLFHQAFGKEKRSLKLGRIDAWIVAFIILCTGYAFLSITNTSADASLAISAFKNYAFYAFLFWLVALTVQKIPDLILVMRTFIIGGIGILFFVLVGLARGEGLWTEYTPLSTEGVRLLAFPHAFYLCMVLVMSLVLLVYRLRPERSSLFLMWGQLVGVIGSLMRHLWGSILAVAIVLWFVLPRVAKRNLIKFFSKNAAVISILIVSIAFIVTVFPLSDASLGIREITTPLFSRARSLANSAADSSARWRVYAWRAAQDSFVANPVFGIGYGQELSIDFETYQRVIPIRDLHNSYLVLLVQMGLLGVIVFTGILWHAVRQLWRSMNGKGMLWPYQLAIASAWLLFLLASVWQPYFETNLTGIFFWILLGLLMVSFRLEETVPAIRR